MPTKLKVSFGLYLINTLVLLVFAFRYFFASELMPYHAETLGVARDGLDAAHSIVVLTLYRANGAGMFSVAVAVLILLWFPFRAGQTWARWALTGLVVLYASLSLYLTLALQAATTAPVPWQGPLVAIVTAVIAHILAKAPARA